MRHGDALSASVDPQRPLSARGRDEVDWVAREISKRDVKVAAIYHSGILRATQTAEIVAQYLAPVGGVHVRSGLLPDDDPAIGMSELEAASAAIMLVGHLPYMNRLAALLINGDPERSVTEFAPATILCCSHGAGRWEFEWAIGPPER